MKSVKIAPSVTKGAKNSAFCNTSPILQSKMGEERPWLHEDEVQRFVGRVGVLPTRQYVSPSKWRRHHRESKFVKSVIVIRCQRG